MEFAEEFNFEAARKVADAAFLAETGEYLDRLEVDVLRGVFQGHKYPKIQEETGQTYDYIKRTGKKIWDTLSAALGEKVTQTNVREALWRKWQASADALTPKRSQNNQYLSVANPEFSEGVVALDSDFYVERSLIESRCYDEIEKPGVLLRIKAPLQTGKTSLMSRVLNHAKLQGYRTVALNLRDTTPEDLSNLDKFLQWFCTIVTEILELTHPVDEHWGKSLGNSKIKCRTYFEKYLLPEDNPLALALDEVDRLFPHREIAGEFLGMLRTWHEDAKTRSLWGQLRQVVLHTEVYRQLDINQSPFNAGTEIKLTDLSQKQVLSLAQQYGLGWDIAQVDQLMDLVGGHPYLVKAALEQVRRQDMTLEQLLQTAPTAFGIYRDHLGRHWRNLQSNSQMATALKKVVMADTPVAFNSELNLDMAVQLDDLGLVTLQSNGATPRYELYRQYFCTRLGDI